MLWGPKNGGMLSKAGVVPEGGSVLLGLNLIDFAGFFFGFFLVCFCSLIVYFTGRLTDSLNGLCFPKGP